MNKKRVNDWLLFAKEAIEKTGICKNGVISKTFRGQISSFGAAIVMGSLPAAIAFFSDQGGASVDRTKLIQAMDYCIRRAYSNKEVKTEEPTAILEYVTKNNNAEVREQYIDAAIALKLAMNFFKLDDRGAEVGES